FLQLEEPLKRLEKNSTKPEAILKDMVPPDTLSDDQIVAIVYLLEKEINGAIDPNNPRYSPSCIGTATGPMAGAGRLSAMALLRCYAKDFESQKISQKIKAAELQPWLNLAQDLLQSTRRIREDRNNAQKPYILYTLDGKQAPFSARSNPRTDQVT